MANTVSNSVRLATVKATGERYIVTSVDFGSGKVYCRGELVRARGLSTTHAAARCFTVAAVELATVEKTDALVGALFAQAKSAARAGRIPGYRG